MNLHVYHNGEIVDNVITLNVENAGAYLAGRGGTPADAWRIQELGGGVSNTVLLAEGPGARLVLKQSLGRLRVAEEWLADRARIHRECAALRVLSEHLPDGAVPRVLFEDAANFVFALEAAPAAARDWKTLLLGGDAREETARRAGEILTGLMKAREEAAGFADQSCFDQLRLDPYYRFTAGRHPDLKAAFDEAIALARRPIGLVHGDFSPKNFLVWSEGLMLIDFEVVHLGDPAFDAAFLLNHFLLKIRHGVERCRGLAQAFLECLSAGMERDVMRHLGCLYLARVDGKSPAEYLTASERVRIRDEARQMITHPPASIGDIFR